jgi:hypothetical protein
MFPRYLIPLALACALLTPLFGSHKDPVFQQINSIVAELAKISGLAEVHPVPYGRMTKPQLRKFLAKRIKKTLRPEEIRADETALKMFGLVPQDFDLKKSTIDLLTEQAAAFYDYDKKKLFLLNESSFSDEIDTLAHELSHALADQHFALEKFMDDNSEDDDANLARTAVVEGQASWLMFAYSLYRNHEPPPPSRQMLIDAFQGDAVDNSQYPVLKASPIYIQQSLLFPYSQGTLFFDAVYRRDGKQSFSEVFTAPPADTMQVIHPDRYFAHQESTRPRLPVIPLNSGNRVQSEGSVGEFDHEMLLWEYFDEKEAKELSPHVLGGQYKIVNDSVGQRPVLLYSSEWDSPQTARRYFAAYDHILQSKWKSDSIEKSTGTLLAGHGDSGYYIVRLKGPVLTSIEGIGSESEWHGLERGQP